MGLGMSDTATRSIQLDESWKAVLQSEFDQQYMLRLREFLLAEKQAGQTIYPPAPEIFAALDTTPFDRTRVVIIGQDPYHGPDQAQGLCFSVRKGVKIPPSLQNIYKELASDLSAPVPTHGDLRNWADQGVLLLNAVLTVRAGQANSHQGKGWETFTDKVIATLNEQRENLVFILWGSYAQKKGSVIDTEKHFVIRSPHPSPLSAHRGFFGSQPFSRCNAYLRQTGQTEINWAID